MRVAPIDLENPAHLSALYILLQSAYSIEANLLGCVDFPPLRESREALRVTREHLRGAWEGDCLVGALAFEAANGHLLITRLAVAPERFRRGVASLLLDWFIHNHRQGDLAVATGTANHPVISLYEKNGFKITDHWKSKEGIQLVRLLRLADSGQENSKS